MCGHYKDLMLTIFENTKNKNLKKKQRTENWLDTDLLRIENS